MKKKLTITGPLQDINVKDSFVIGILILLCIAVAVGVVFTKHLSRTLHTELSSLNMEKIQLHNEKSQLLLEQATWSSNMRVEMVAREQLSMIMPDRIEMIKP
jgi:cell division protein FtsL